MLVRAVTPTPDVRLHAVVQTKFHKNRSDSIYSNVAQNLGHEADVEASGSLKDLGRRVRGPWNPGD
jgi:hypothetical protein